MKKINLEQFIDYREFLREYYNLRKSENIKFSYTYWTKEIGITNRGYLRLVINRHRNLTEAGMSKIIPTLGFTKKEREYFIHLVHFNQAKSVDERELAFSKLQLLKAKNTYKVHCSYEFLSSHWCPKIQVILGLNNVDKSTIAISKMLGIGKNETEQHLKTLQDLNMVEFINEQWVDKKGTFCLSDETENLAIQSFHKKGLEKAIEAINKPSDTRYYNSVLVALTEDNYQQVASEINAFSDSILFKYSKKNNDNNQNRRLYQININNIPVSKSLIHRRSTDDVSKINAGNISLLTEEKELIQ